MPFRDDLNLLPSQERHGQLREIPRHLSGKLVVLPCA